MVDNAESTIVGESILITGSLHGDEDLTILGRVEGNLSLSKTLVVAESGIVKAEVSVRNAIVSGVLVGNITASDSVEVTESGRLVGDIRAPRVIIVAGARVRGAVDMGDLEAPRPSGPLPTRTTRPSSTLTRSTSLPPRRPPAPTPAPAPVRRPDPTPVAKKPAAEPTPAPQPTPAPAPAETKKAEPRKAPVAARKIKKKVVVKKKG